MYTIPPDVIVGEVSVNGGDVDARELLSLLLDLSDDGRGLRHATRAPHLHRTNTMMGTASGIDVASSPGPPLIKCGGKKFPLLSPPTLYQKREKKDWGQGSFQ